jgi:AraC-like DNA-binding protein
MKTASKINRRQSESSVTPARVAALRPHAANQKPIPQTPAPGALNPIPPMPAPLGRIQNWPELARQAQWSASALAKLCGVSVRTLERFFQKTTGLSPKVWLQEQRQQQAIKLLKDGRTVKEAADGAGYQHASTFSREFKKYWGVCPVIQSPAAKAGRPRPVA